MCGIFGFVANRTNNNIPLRKIADQLFILSESRGKEASGISTLTPTSINVLKLPLQASQLIKTKEYDEFWEKVNQTFSFLGHSRLATNGLQSENRNNQPVYSKRTVGVHNGMILNDVELWKKYPTFHRQSEVDTEVFIALFDYFTQKGLSLDKTIKRVYDLIQGAVSIALFLSDYPVIVLATNTGSLYYARTKSSFIFASERYILEQAIIKTKLDQLMPIDTIQHLTAGFACVVDKESLFIDAFSLKSNRKMKVNIKQYNKPLIVHNKTPDSIDSFYHSEDLYQNSLNKLSTHEPDYNAIKKLQRCTKCILPETMPYIYFDREGICNFCHEYKPQTPLGSAALKKYVSAFRKNNGKPDCIVALSGGRDSSFGLHFVKTVLKMNPMAYTYDWGMVTDIARRNQYNMTARLGVEHIIVSADIKRKCENIRKNIEAWLKKPTIGMVPLFMAGDKQAEYYAEEVKRKTGVKLIIYCRGNQLEDERFKFGYMGIYDGTPQGVLHNLSTLGKIKMALYTGKQYLLNPSYLNSSLIDTFFAYFSAYLMSHEFVYLWHYIPWSEKDIVSVLRQQYNWETPNDTIATWRIDDGTPPFYNYIYYTVQGFTEHDGLRSNQIREGHIKREDALKLAWEENKPRYEALQWYFDRVGMNGHKVLSVVDKIPKRY